MAAKNLSSITDDTARRFLSTAAERETLFCKKVTGLHLIKLKSGGSWRYRYRSLAGKRRTATLGRYTELKPQQAAKNALDLRDRDVLSERAESRQQAKLEAARAQARTLGDYLDGPYTEYQLGRLVRGERVRGKPSGAETLQMIRRNFKDWLERDMATLSRADVREWQHQKEDAGLAHASLKRAYGALKTMLNRAATKEDPPVLDENPLEHVNLEKSGNSEAEEQLKKKRKDARRLLSDDEIQQLYTGLEAFVDEIRTKRRNSRKHGRAYLPDLDVVAHPHWFIPFTYCALYTGMRPGDLYSLTWEELNINFGRLIKTPEKTRHHGEKAAEIKMDLPDELLSIMREWWEQQGKPSAGLVYPSPVNSRQMDKKAHTKAWARVKQLGGLPEDLVFYALRHNFISKLVASGVPLLTIARLVGHKSVAMIEQNYGHLCPDAARDVLSNFAQQVRKGSTHGNTDLPSLSSSK
nr:hypothetical protein 1 [Gammaproteobacteria bacterium]